MIALIISFVATAIFWSAASLEAYRHNWPEAIAIAVIGILAPCVILLDRWRRQHG